MNWMNISELSRHPPHGSLIKITTQSGRSVTTTLSHSHLRKQGDSIVPILGKDLKLGHRIPVMKKCPIPLTGIKSINISDFITNYDKVENGIIYAGRTKLTNTIISDKANIDQT